MPTVDQQLEHGEHRSASPIAINGRQRNRRRTRRANSTSDPHRDQRSSERPHMQGRDWCFTLNNPTEEEIRTLREKLGDPEVCRYACFQRETGASGTHHLQGYLELRRNGRLTAVRRVHPRAHYEPRRGSRDQARDYCRKTDETVIANSFEEFGTWVCSQQGKRNDLKAAKEYLKTHTVQEAALEYPETYARYPRFFTDMKNFQTEPRMFKTKVHVYIGPTGCGKTSTAYENFPGIWKKPPGAWYDSYDCHENVLIDDFNGRDIEWSMLLQILDRYPMDVPIKGAFRKFVPRNIIITTNFPIDDWYPCIADKSPLHRRIDEVRTWAPATN